MSTTVPSAADPANTKYFMVESEAETSSFKTRILPPVQAVGTWNLVAIDEFV